MNLQNPYRYKLEPYVVCLAASLFFFYIFIQLNVFNALNPALIQTFHVDATTLSHLSDRYFLANVLFLIPAGIILDRLPTRMVIVVGTLACVLATFGFALSTSLWEAETCRFAIGICGSFCLLSDVRIASRWFPANKLAFIIGLAVTLAMLGGMLAQCLTPLVDKIGWRETLFVDGGVGVLLLTFIYLFVKDRPQFPLPHTCHHEAPNTVKGFLLSFCSVISKPQNWFAGLYTSLMNLPIFLIGAMWGNLYLVQTQHLTRASASVVTMMIFLGMIIGSPAVGWISDYFRRRKSPMVIGAIAAIINMYVIMYVPNLSFLMLCLLVFSLGFIISTQIISYPLIAESNPLNITATAESLASTLIMAGGFTQSLFAKLMQQGWDGKIIDNIPFYSMSNYRHAFMIMLVAFIISLVLALLIKETHCVPLQITAENNERMVSFDDKEVTLAP